jgi:hypothetical protein
MRINNTELTVLNLPAMLCSTGVHVFLVPRLITPPPVTRRSPQPRSWPNPAGSARLSTCSSAWRSRPGLLILQYTKELAGIKPVPTYEIANVAYSFKLLEVFSCLQDGSGHAQYGPGPGYYCPALLPGIQDLSHQKISHPSFLFTMGGGGVCTPGGSCCHRKICFKIMVTLPKFKRKIW